MYCTTVHCTRKSVKMTSVRYYVQRVNIWEEVKLPFFCRTSRTYPQFRNPRSFARSWLERAVLTIYGIYMDNRLNYAFRYVHGRLPQNES
jgi:hypothetical protein